MQESEGTQTPLPRGGRATGPPPPTVCEILPIPQVVHRKSYQDPLCISMSQVDMFEVDEEAVQEEASASIGLKWHVAGQLAEYLVLGDILRQDVWPKRNQQCLPSHSASVTE